MPNWVQTKLVITGPEYALDRLAKQVSQPYEAEYYNHTTNSYDTSTVEGEFLLWNIVKPTDLDSYYKRAENAIRAEERAKQKEALDKAADIPKVGEIIIQTFMEEVNERLGKFDHSIIEKIRFEYEFGDDWYNWNNRNWGTKWEIYNARLERTKPMEMVYFFSTAWAPPVEALNILASQNPEVAMTLKSHDEGDMFACEIHWNAGLQTHDQDLPINHYLFEELYGACFVCEDGTWSDDEARQHYACPQPANTETANA